MKIDSAAYEDWADIKALLRESGLPHGDIQSARLDRFLVVRDGARIAGVAGMEPCGAAALLRSLAVGPGYRGFGFASKLLAGIEEQAKAEGTRALYLLTTTAEGFFEKKGYRRIDRRDAPEAIRSMPQFGGL